MAGSRADRKSAQAASRSASGAEIGAGGRHDNGCALGCFVFCETRDTESENGKLGIKCIEGPV